MIRDDYSLYLHWRIWDDFKTASLFFFSLIFFRKQEKARMKKTPMVNLRTNLLSQANLRFQFLARWFGKTHAFLGEIRSFDEISEKLLEKYNISSLAALRGVTLEILVFPSHKASTFGWFCYLILFDFKLQQLEQDYLTFKWLLSLISAFFSSEQEFSAIMTGTSAIEKRTLLAQQILSSELTYMKHLSVIQSVFKKPLEAALASNRLALLCFQILVECTSWNSFVRRC